MKYTSPPRRVVRVRPGVPLFRRRDGVLLVAGLLLASVVLFPDVLLRAAALSLGQETEGLIVSIERGRSRSRWTTYRKVAFSPGQGKKIRFFNAETEIGFNASSEQLPKSVRVSFVPSLPFIVGLVDDEGRSEDAMIVLSVLFIVLLGFPLGRHTRELRRQKWFLEKGVAVPFSIAGTVLDSTRITYTFEGQTYRKRVSTSKVTLLKKAGFWVFVDPQRPSRFYLDSQTGPFGIEP